MTHLVRWARHVRFAHSRRAVFALTTLGLAVALVAGLLVVGPTFAAPPSPSLTLSPTAAPPGASVTVSGANFGCKSVDLAFDSTNLGTASPSKKTFSASITVPSSAPAGQHMLTASCAGHKGAAQAPFTVLPSADLTVDACTAIILEGAYRLGYCPILVTNHGPDSASNVVVTFSTKQLDKFPFRDPAFGVDRISAGSFDPGAMQWTIASMLPYSSEILNLTVAAPPTPQGEPHTFRTDVVVRSDTADPSADYNLSTFETDVLP